MGIRGASSGELDSDLDISSLCFLEDGLMESWENLDIYQTLVQWVVACGGLANAFNLIINKIQSL